MKIRPHHASDTKMLQLTKARDTFRYLKLQWIKQGIKYGLYFTYNLSHFARSINYEITPEPINSSFTYHAANCPAVIPLCGSSKTTYIASLRR